MIAPAPARKAIQGALAPSTPLPATAAIEELRHGPYDYLGESRGDSEPGGQPVPPPRARSSHSAATNHT